MQRDFILRMIEQIGAALAELRRMILGGGQSAAVDEALVHAASQAGFDIHLLRSFTVETLHMFVAPAGDVDPTRCWLIAEVLYLDGLHASLERRDVDALDSLVKARALYDLIRPAGGMLVGMPEADERIAEIDGLINLVPQGRRPDGESDSGRPRRLRASGRRRPAATTESL